jgi:hypothetical protein
LGTSQSGAEVTLHWQDWPLAVTVTNPTDGELTKFSGVGFEVALKKHELVLDS